MNTSEPLSIGSQLCAQCGLCCNGVLFHMVQLQPADSMKDLVALGLKLKRKKGRKIITQPCPALCNQQCSIYAARPERCRLFECRQLRRLTAGEITEAVAMEKINEARRRVDQINDLLLQAGKTDLRRPLSKRCEKVMAERLAPSADPAMAALQGRLMQAMRALNTLLDDDFRVDRDNVPDAHAGGFNPGARRRSRAEQRSCRE